MNNMPDDLNGPATPVVLADNTIQNWWRGAVIYQIYPRSFVDSNHDGIGDLPGITSQLEYVASLGVDAIWISPFFKSPMRDFGYDVSDLCAVDPIFGNMADFDSLLDKAHALGLKVLIDQVYSHTSDLHAWFEESRQSSKGEKADWYVWADAKPDGTPPNNWQSVFGGPAWTWDARREQYYLHNFLPEQPDLNLHNPAVQQAALDTMQFWLDKGVDGLRLDAVNFSMHDPELTDNPPVARPEQKTRPFDFQHHLYNKSHVDIPKFLGRLRKLADSYGDRFLVAEVGGETALNEMREYTSTPQLLHSAYGFSYLYASSLSPAIIAENQSLWCADRTKGWPSWAFSNHDAPRAVSRWASTGDRQKMAELGLLLLLCLRGNVFIYQGEELGLPQAEVPFAQLQDPEAIANWPQTLGRDGARTPMPWTSDKPLAGFSSVGPWLPVDTTHFDLSVASQEARSDTTLQTARKLIRLRQSLAPLKTGKFSLEKVEEQLLVFKRIGDTGAILCAFNLGNTAEVWSLPKGWRVLEQVNMNQDCAGLLPAYAGLIAIAE